MEDSGDLAFLTEYASARVNRAAEQFLLQDPRFQRPDAATKRELLAVLGLRPDGPWSHQAFDLLRTPVTTPVITPATAADHASDVELIEVKGTRASINDATLNRFFFGATATQFALAQAVPDRFRWGFVVLSAENLYERPFYVLLTAYDVEERVRRARVQYQIDFRSDLSPETLAHAVPEFMAAQMEDEAIEQAAEVPPSP